MKVVVILLLMVCSFCAGLSNYDIFQSILPTRLAEISVATPRLYAQRYLTVEELIEELIGDVKYIQEFNTSKPFDLNYEDYDVSRDAPIKTLSYQLTAELYLKLWRIYQEFSKVFEILELMDENDYLAIYSHIYGDNDTDISMQGLDDWEAEFEGMSWDDMIDKDKKTYAFVPFIYGDEPIQESPIGEGEEVHAQIFFKSVLKIILFIIKLIAKIFWNLIEIKKLVELAETKIVLTIIKLIEMICKIITRLKKVISYKIRLFIYSIKSGALLERVVTVIMLIIKKLKVLSWILKDLLYRYKWKLIFLLKKAKKTSLLIAIYLQELVYAKLGVKTREEKSLAGFVSYDRDAYDWDDYNYFEEFAHYYYSKPGTYKSENDDIAKIIERGIKQIEEEEREREREFKGDMWFDLDEEFGFDSISLTPKALKEKRRRIHKKNARTQEEIHVKEKQNGYGYNQEQKLVDDH